MTSQLKELTPYFARPLPVILLADVSGSMATDGKIDALNQSVREMLATFASSDDLLAEIHVSIITFGGEARIHVPIQPARAIKWSDMGADGGTPMGQAMNLAADLVEDKGKIPARAFRPTVVLISDDHPTDSWKIGLDRITKQGRAQMADRMALAIGGDADTEMLRQFLNDDKKPLFLAADARRIKDFFRFVAMSVTTRSRSANPNALPQMQNPFDLDRL